MEPSDFIISRKRKKYKFAIFAQLESCFEAAQLTQDLVFEKAAGKLATIEVGAGTALFAVELARRHADQFFIACDVKADRLQTGARLAHEESLTNIIFVRAHINEIKNFVPARSVQNIWLTFSDPFPKKRDAKHRLMHPDFLVQYASLLQPGGFLLIKTDAQALFDWGVEQLSATGWKIDELSRDLHTSDLNEDYKIMTSYEQRFVAQALPIYFVKAQPLA